MTNVYSTQNFVKRLYSAYKRSGERSAWELHHREDRPMRRGRSPQWRVVEHRRGLTERSLGTRLLHSMSAGRDLGSEFARALADKDVARLSSLIHDEIDFRGMTPNRTWEATDRDGVLDILLANWFEDTDEIESVERLETDAFADRHRVGYRLNVTNPDGRFLVEQQAYLVPRDGQISWMRVLCSGYRPVAG